MLLQGDPSYWSSRKCFCIWEVKPCGHSPVLKELLLLFVALTTYRDWRLLTKLAPNIRHFGVNRQILFMYDFPGCKTLIFMFIFLWTWGMSIKKFPWIKEGRNSILMETLCVSETNILSCLCNPNARIIRGWMLWSLLCNRAIWTDHECKSVLLWFCI